MSKWEVDGRVYEKKGTQYQRKRRAGMAVEKGTNCKVKGGWKQKDWDELLKRFADGELLVDICAENTSPARASLYHKIRTDEEFRKAYELAREMHVDARAEKTQKIADDSSKDFTIDEDGKKVFHSVPVSRDALRIKTAQWLLSKLEPKKYGDKVQQEISGDLTSMQPVINIISGGVDGKEDSPLESGATPKAEDSV